jgi:glucose/arabinose dehydrogenase
MSHHRMIEPLEPRQLLSTLPAGFSETTIAKIDTTVSATMAFAPDGRLFVGDTKNGKIRIVKNNVLLASEALSLNVDHAIERGINGIAFAPNFATAAAGQKYVFIYYTKPDPLKPNQNPSNAKNRLSRFTISSTNADKLDPASEKVLLDNVSATAGNHNGGALHFGADGMLYLAIGEAAVPSDAQKLSTYNGKVLRINAMNESNLVPADNPFLTTTGALPLIWALGFRNPFTGAFKPGTNTLYINDVGQSSWEEIDNVKKGLNYGWPVREGNDGGDPNYEDPVFTYPNTGGFAITGSAFYNGAQFPATYAGKYFFGDFAQKKIWWLDEANKKQVLFADATLQVVDIDVNPKDGSLWYLGLNGSVQRISFSTGNRAPTAAATANKTSGLKPLAVTFDGSGSSDPDGDALTYSWNFGDGSSGAGKTITHTFANDGKYNVVLTVNDGRGGSDAANPIAIQVGNNAPVPKITSPIANSLYTGGQTISFAGSATDPEDGTLAASKFEWSVVFHHNTHTHPFRTSIPGVTSGTFVIPKVGEVDPNQWYSIHLTVTDSGGLKSSTVLDIKPRTSTFTLATNVTGLKLSLDSAAATTAPRAVKGVVGMTRTIEAPLTQSINGKLYDFVSWSDGKAIKHTFDIPTSNTTYTATYREVTAKTLRATADATVRDGKYAGQNFGGALTIDVKKNNSGWNRYSYLKFDIASIATLSTAKLRLYGKLDNIDAKNIPIEIFGVSSTTWAENTINWNNKPATGTTAIGKFTVADTTARYYEVDISKYVKDQKAAGKSVIAIALKSNVFTSPLAVFNSDENASNKPQLVVNVSVTITAAAAARIASDIGVTSRSSLWSQLEEEPTGLA